MACFTDASQSLSTSFSEQTHSAKNYFEEGKKYFLEKNNDKSVLAVELFKKAIELGNHEAEGLLADCYAWGFGLKRNFYSAKEFYKKSAANGVSEAMYKLALCHLRGIGVTSNAQKAERSLKQATEMKYKETFDEYVRRIYPSSPYQEIPPIEMLIEAADQGNMQAMFLYMTASESQKTPLQESERVEKEAKYSLCLKKEAQLGNPELLWACYNAELPQAKASSSYPDPSQASTWAAGALLHCLVEAAKTGHVDAKIELASFLSKTFQDCCDEKDSFSKAELLFTEAAKAGRFDALIGLNQLYGMAKVTIDPSKKRELRKLAEELINKVDPFTIFPKSYTPKYGDVLGLTDIFKDLSEMGHTAFMAT